MKKGKRTGRHLLAYLFHDPLLLQRVSAVNKRVARVLESAFPRASEKLLSSVAVDLADLWQASQQHARFIAEISGMKLPRDKARLEEILCYLDAHAFHMRYHANSLLTEVPRLLASDRKRAKSAKRRPVSANRASGAVIRRKG